jgi:steroid 5-alpha reductase family enzyme
MAALWAVHLVTRNAGIVDVGWSASVPILAIFYVLRAGGSSRGWWLAVMVALWGFRLATHIFLRMIGRPEEGRYVEIRREYGRHATARFLWLFQMQALVAVVLSLPFFLVAREGGDPGVIEWIGAGWWAVSWALEFVADGQLARFKRDPANRGRVCDVGLWRFSRHPNYFFESMIWIGYAIYALGSPHGWLGFLSPAMMLYFLLRVTGVPLAEAQALRTRGDAYRRYQAKTSVFVPWFPRRG